MRGPHIYCLKFSKRRRCLFLFFKCVAENLGDLCALQFSDSQMHFGLTLCKMYNMQSVNQRFSSKKSMLINLGVGGLAEFNGYTGGLACSVDCYSDAYI